MSTGSLALHAAINKRTRQLDFGYGASKGFVIGVLWLVFARGEQLSNVGLPRHGCQRAAGSNAND
jgi:hypothetical protein